MKEGLQHTGAFVVRFCVESNFATRQVEGRVEHVATGQTIHFNSLDELLRFFSSVLSETQIDKKQP